MLLDESLRDRVVLAGGKVIAIGCPDCEFDGRDLDVTSHTPTAVDCPQCDATLLTANQKSQLRRADKL